MAALQPQFTSVSADINQLRHDVVSELQPVKEELAQISSTVHGLEGRVEELEKKESDPRVDSLVKEVEYLKRQNDFADRERRARFAIIGGWSDNSSEQTRIDKMTQILKELKCYDKVVGVKCFSKNKKLTTVGSVEFKNPTDRNKFVDLAEDKKGQFSCDSSKLWIGKDKPWQVQLRNKAMKTVASAIGKKFPKKATPVVYCKGDERVVKVGDLVVFTQNKTGVDGTWHPDFAAVSMADYDVSMGF